MKPALLPAAARAALLLGFAAAVVDENGRYQSGVDISSLAPPELSDADKEVSVDLSKQPIEKLFRLLAYELMKEEERLPERRLGVRDFQVVTELSCQDRWALILQESQNISEEVKWYHLNATGTAGLYWLLHEYPEEHSWAWLLPSSHDKVMRRVSSYLLMIAVLAADDPENCLSEGFRTVLMQAGATWKKIHGDHAALLWNGVAFGALGDVTSWRSVDDDGQAEDGPGGPPPNVSWSENIIFGNMWLSSVQRWLEYHSQEVLSSLYSELGRLQAGQAPERPQWRAGQDGVVSAFECMRRQIFGGWQVDKGLLRGVLRHCLRPDYTSAARPSVADFGAGGGGYSTWLNDTGLVEAFAFDAANSISDITRGAVQEVNLARAVDLWRKFDWVLCLEVAAHVPESHARGLLQNAARHATSGLIVSWSAADGGAAVVNGLEEASFVSFVERETGCRLDREATDAVRGGCELPHIAKTVAVFRAPGAASQ